MRVIVYNVIGKEVMSLENSSRIDLSDFTNGIYTLSISLDNKKPFYKKVVLSK